MSVRARIRRRRVPQVVLWGARRGDVQYGSLRWRIFRYERELGLSLESGARLVRGASDHYNHVHIADLGGPYDIVVEPGSARP